MKTVMVKAYTLRELKTESPETFKRVLSRLSDEVMNSPADFIGDECVDSLKKLCKVLGLKLTDWSIGPYQHSHLSFIDLSEGDEDAMPIKERLDLFLSSQGYTVEGKTSFPGFCALTGVCYDDDLLEHLYKHKGDVGSLALKISKMMEENLDYHASEEGILENHGDERYFTLRGKEVTNLLKEAEVEVVKTNALTDVAPDMLKALKYVVDGGFVDSHRHPDTFARVISVINKAEGK